LEIWRLLKKVGEERDSVYTAERIEVRDPRKLRGNGTYSQKVSNEGGKDRWQDTLDPK